MLLSKKRTTKALIRLRGGAGWSAPVLFANPRRQVFSRRGPNVSCSMTRRSDAGEARNRGPLVSSSQCLNTKCGQGKRFGTGPGRRPDWAGYGSRLFGQTHSCHPLGGNYFGYHQNTSLNTDQTVNTQTL